jgi:hypothetical protein
LEAYADFYPTEGLAIRSYDTGNAAADCTMVLQGVYDKVQFADSEPTGG